MVATKEPRIPAAGVRCPGPWNPKGLPVSCGLCGFIDGEPAITTVCGIPLGARCVANIRAIARDAGVVVDEGLLTGKLRSVARRALTRAEEFLEARREIEEARGLARMGASHG